MGNFITKTEECMMVSGDKIRCKDMGNCIINLGNWLTRATGKLTNFQETEFCITRFPIR